MKSIKYFLLLGFSVMIIGCTNYQWEPDNSRKLSSCENCHTDYALLQQVFTPDTAAPVGGCGGEAPHYEPYDRVFMGGTGYENYMTEFHYKLECSECHNGNPKANDKTLAHGGDFISHPSMFAEEKCASCHAEIVENFATSLHNGTGQKRKVTLRSGLNGPDEFDQLPAHQIEGYNKNCATCHASCGSCHTVRPPIAGGGLANGHEFTKTPDMVTVCVSCHVSRGGHAFLGVASGTLPDVHLTKAGFRCTNCHDAAEMHGSGVKVEQRYAYDRLPVCQECHTSSATSNNYHSMHYTDFNCQVCHSQNYNNCGSCHIHAEGARVPSYLDFKIAVNPLPDLKPGFEFTLVRRTLAAPDNWEVYGVDEYANFNVLPTYNYTSPHNILRWTTRTQVENGKACSSNCHIRNENGTLVNKQLYLFQENLLDWEMTATSPITVDNKLPASWSK